MTYGAHDALADVLVDLWDYDDLTTLLEDSDAISAGWPKDEQSYPVVVRVQPITETSGQERAGVRRQFRMQVSVVATESWRSEQVQPTYRMAEIMSAVADRLDKDLGPENLLPGNTASGSWQDVVGNRLALIQDWQIDSLDTS